MKFKYISIATLGLAIFNFIEAVWTTFTMDDKLLQLSYTQTGLLFLILSVIIHTQLSKNTQPTDNQSLKKDSTN